MERLSKPKKSLGQHWLSDPASLQAICEVAKITTQDTVLEIGPGPGTLTTYLVRVAKQVVAVELDSQLAKELPRNVPVDNLSVVEQDILKFDLTSLPPDYKVVANIPYYLTSHLIRVLSETPNRPATVVLLVQKEVAERVAAEPGQMSLLSVTAQFYWQVSLGQVVPAELFVPPPKVDSQVLILERREQPLFPNTEPKEYFRLVKAGFANRRKTLVNSLAGGLHLTKEEASQLLQAAHVQPTARPQELTLEQWRQILDVLSIRS